MLIFHTILSALTGMAVLLLIFNTYLAWRTHNRIYLALGLLCLGGVIYIPCNLLLYNATSPEQYINILSVQMVGTAFYHIGLVWCYLIYLNIRQRWPLMAVCSVFGFFLVARMFNPMLNYASFSGMTDYFLVWGEQLHLPITSVSGWGILYTLLIYCIYLMAIGLSILQIRRERARAMQALICTLLLIAMVTNDTLVLFLNLRWLFLGDLGLTLLALVMEMAAANEILRVNRLSGKIRESEEQYRLLVETAIEGIWTIDENHRTTFVNQAMAEMLGYTPAEMLGKTAEEFSYPESDDIVSFEQHMQRRHAGENEIYERRLKKRDGSPLWTLAAARVLQDDQGRFNGSLAMITDITERKHAEQRLRENEEKFRRLFETSLDFLYITDAQGRIIDVNRTASKMSGYSVDELKNIFMQDLYYDAHARDALIERLDEQGFVENYEIKGKKKDGSAIEILVNASAIKAESGNVTGFQGNIKDITERKQTEEALRQSEEKFRTMIEQATEGFALLDEDGLVIEWNRALEHIWGWQREEVLGQPFYDIQFRVMLPERRTQERYERIKNALVDACRSGQSPLFNHPIEAELCRSDGSRVFVEQSIFPIKTGRGYRIGSMSLDISERKRAEAALRESEERLRSVLNSIEKVAVQGYKQDGAVTFWNKASELLYGYTASDMVGKDILGLLRRPETRAAERDMMAEAVRTGKLTPSGEVTVGRKDGSQVWVYASRVLIRQAEREPEFFNFNFDITERKQAEEHLSQQVERLRALHTIEQAIVSSMDLQTVLELLVKEIVKQLQVDAASVLLWNPQKQTLDFAAGKGFRTKALRFTSLKIGAGLAGQAAQTREIVHITDLAELQQNPVLARSIVNEKFVTYFGVPLIAKSQLLGVLEIFHRSTLAPDPNWLRFLETLAGQAAISVDNARLWEITQKNLKETNALYQITQDMASTMDPGQLMDDVVNLLQESFAYYYVQIFVKQPETGDFIMRAGSGSLGAQLKSQGYRLAAGEGIVGYTAETEKPFFTNNVDDGISFVRTPYLPDTKSELAVPIKTGARFLGLLDIHQAPPAQLTERDVQLVSAVADQLAVAMQKAQLYSDLQNSLLQEQSMRSQLVQSEKLAIAGRLLASVSHELNNPLQAIQNALFLVKTEANISTQALQDLDIIISEAERMATLLERLRTTYQPAQAEDFQPVQINDIIENVYALMTTHLRHAHISFELHSDPSLPRIPGLGNQLKQVLLNLFLNAVDAMSTGGRLIVSTTWREERKEILVSISDTGTGIAETILPDIFEAFITNKDGGTGLGLAISYEIILKHHGRIRAENNLQGGATFNIWLPTGNGGAQ